MSKLRDSSRRPLRCLLIGVDGATDDVIGPMMAEGKLPNLARLRCRGAYGRLRSQPGYSSPALWTTIESGYSPDEHGITGFPTALRANLRKPRLQERLGRLGWRVGLCRMFCNWPPAENEVFVVPSFADVSAKAHPEWVAPLCQGKQLHGFGRKVWYLLHVLGAGLGKDACAGLIRAGLAMRHLQQRDHRAYFLVQTAQQLLYTRLFCQLLGICRPHYAAYMFGIADSVGHRYWDRYENWKHGSPSSADRQLGSVVPKTYEAIDKGMGEILRFADAETVVFIVSDHGMELVRQGGTNLVPASSLHRRLELPYPVEGYYAGLTAYLGLASAKGNLTDLLNKVRATRVDGLGTGLFDPCAMVGSRIRLGVARDIPVRPDSQVRMWNGARVPLSDLVRCEPRRPSDHGHGPDGILLMCGRGVKPGSTLTDATQYDVVPTLLRLLGMPVPVDLPGRLLREAVHDGLVENVRQEDAADENLEATPTALSEKEKEVLEKRLRELGYVD